jgi:hypothetical protein
LPLANPLFYVTRYMSKLPLPSNNTNMLRQHMIVVQGIASQTLPTAYTTIAKRPARPNAKNGGARSFAAPDFAVLLAEAAADVVEELLASTVPNGVMVTVELFAHWLEGNRVALALNVISAH